MAPELLREGHSPGLFPVGNYSLGLKTTGKVGRARFGVWIIGVFLLGLTRSSIANSFSCCTQLDFTAGYADKNNSWGCSCWMEPCWGLGSGAGGKKMENQQWEKPDWEAATQSQNPWFYLKFCVAASEFWLVQSEFSGGDSDTFPEAPGADSGWNGIENWKWKIPFEWNGMELNEAEP